MASSTSLIIITNQQENEKISPKKINKQYNETTSNPNNIVDT